MDTRDETIKSIARSILGLETLQLRGRDRLDFHDLSVSRIKRALEAAFEAGRQSRRPAPARRADHAE
jgi:hypothetical protein